MLCAFLFKPVKHNVPTRKPKLKDVFSMSLVHNQKYMIWTGVIAVSLFGYFVPYVLMLKFVEENYAAGTDTKLPILCIGVTSGLGRLLFGYVADLPKVNRIYLQQLSFLSIGVLTMVLPYTSGHYGWLLFITLGMGLFDGCFISLLGKQTHVFNNVLVKMKYFHLKRVKQYRLLRFYAVNDTNIFFKYISFATSIFPSFVPVLPERNLL